MLMSITVMRMEIRHGPSTPHTYLIPLDPPLVTAV